ncbi:carboxypeptidase B-like [Apostichopus japonicus]|uniref:carboxypeptidase B-like n=1 Tax=Stichopus japonicus TaxID=307972 RepID=UPI003AB38042
MTDFVAENNEFAELEAFAKTCEGRSVNIIKLGGSSSSPCSDTYMGTKPASEIEVSNLQNHILSMKDRVKIFMDVHAYRQYWMYPYGYSTELPEDDDDLYGASRVAVQAIRATHGKWFQYGSIANVIYVSSGSSVDWAYDVAGIKHSYALELRDRGQYGFLSPRIRFNPRLKNSSLVQKLWSDI